MYKNIFFSTLQKISNWASSQSMWPLSCGLSCCAIEMMQAAASRYDLDQFGCLFRSSPRHADLMIIAGTITKKMAPQLKNLYNQMVYPKFVIAMGNCAISGGLYRNSPYVINGAFKILPVDIEVTGCPPTPSDLIMAIRKLQSQVLNRKSSI